MEIISIEKLENIAKTGDSEANYELGLRYYKGVGVGVDYVKARGYFETALKNGCNSASYYLGIIHYNGQGTEINHVKAKEYFEKSDKDNNTFSSYYLGKIYYWGDGVEKNIEKANSYKTKVLSKPFFANQDTDIENFYSYTDFEGITRNYATNLQRKVQTEFTNLFGNEIQKL